MPENGKLDSFQRPTDHGAIAFGGAKPKAKAIAAKRVNKKQRS